MNRTAFGQLAKWKDGQFRKSLIVRGARQIGKTYAIREFARTHFADQCVVVDFEKIVTARQVFEQDLIPKRILRELEIILKASIVPGKTLLFF